MITLAPRTLCFAGNRTVLIGRSQCRVNHQHDHVGIRDRPTRREHADRLDLTRSRHASRLSDPCGVDDAKLALMPSELHIHGIARRARNLADQNTLFPQHTVHER